MTDQSRADLIRQYAKAGIHVNPVYVSEGKDGKKAVRPVGKWRDTSSASSADVEAWFGAGGECADASVLIDCGKSRLVVIDPDGPEGIANWEALGATATPARARTPGGGQHHYYREHPKHVIGNDQDGKIAPHVDVRGLGGFVIAPPSFDWRGAYAWIDGPPDWDAIPIVPDLVIERMKAKAVALPVVAGVEDAFDSVGGEERRFTEKEAEAFVLAAYAKLKATRQGFNGAINNFAMACAHFPLWYPRERCARLMMKGLGTPQGWAGPDAEDWKTIESAYGATEAGRSWVAVERTAPDDTGQARTEPDGSKPQLQIKSVPTMMYWLEENLGRGYLSGMFNRGGAVVHTPAVGAEGYIPPREGSDGPMQVRPVERYGLASLVQFSYQCFAMTEKKDKAGNSTWETTDGQFPLGAAGYAVAAADMMPHLRPLRGVTHTPIMRKDGSILDQPGYDEVTGLLYAPMRGLHVQDVPERPTGGEVAAALAHLRGMVSDFPFVTPGDEANWLGMMLTPLMREVVPSDRKMFAVNAHQAGSGKTLLAKLGEHTHGAVFRSALPEDEAEMRKWATGVLSTTTAPMVIADNVTGTMRSAFLAGLLTSQTLTDRVLGKSENVEMRQDRMWVITGNNVQIGGDIHRRLVTIAIDPDMERPETRTGFAIADLERYAVDHRGQTLHALLTLMRAWVVAGRPTSHRDQSDSFLAWEAAVGGVLAVAGLAAGFNEDVTRGEVKDVDREDFGDFLAKLYEVFGDKPFYMKDLLDKTSGETARVDGGLFDETRPIGPGDMPSSRLAEKLSDGKFIGGSLGKLMGYKTKQYHGGYALIAGEKDRSGIPWRIKVSSARPPSVD